MNKSVLDCKAPVRVGTPTEANFIDIVRKGTLANFPVTLVDIANARHMFGPDIPGVKIKTVQRKLERVEVEYIISITSDYHRFVSVTLTSDGIFVNSMPFLIILARRIRIHNVEHIPSRTAKKMGSSLTKIVSFYARGGFVVSVLLMNEESEKISDEVHKFDINTTAAREHIG